MGSGALTRNLTRSLSFRFPQNLTRLLRYSAPIFGRPASLRTFKPRIDVTFCCVVMPDAAQLSELAARMLAFAMQAKDQDLLEWLCIRAGDYLDQRQGLILRHRKRPQASSKRSSLSRMNRRIAKLTRRQV